VGESKKARLLVVEDDVENQKFLRIYLRRNFDIEFCDSAESFYQKLSENNFDIILMDISLRGPKDGLQLTQELRNNPVYHKIPIVGLSAHAFQRDKDNAYRAGIDIFLTKPVRGEILLENLMTALKDKLN
jgi:CheY-like chemotaxis protein